jgi:hypothetical protein
MSIFLFSHQSTLLFSQNKSATTHQQPASSTFLSEQISTSQTNKHYNKSFDP